MDPTNEKIRVALVITELEVGGAERCMTNLALRLNREKFEPRVCALGPRPSGQHVELVETLEANNVPIRFLGLRSARHVLRAIRQLKSELVAQSPDIVQTFLFHANVVGALAASRAGVPSIIGGIRVADPSVCRHRVERWSSRRVDRIVSVSESVAEFCRTTARLPEEKLVVIPNGIDVGALDDAERIELHSLGVSERRRALVCVGRLEKQKGLDWLLPIMPGILEQLPDCDLLLVGDGPERAALEKSAAQWQIKDRVHFAGRQENVAGILKSSRALLLPSRWEGMPNVVLEAMACGLPVVCSDVQGVAELLGSRSDEQCVPLGDAESFAEKVVSIARNDAFASELGAANRARIAAEFTLDQMIRRYERLYESLVEPPKRCRKK